MSDVKGASRSSGMNIDSKLVRELAELLAETGLSEIEVEDGDRKIKVKREAAPVMAYAPAPAMATAPAAVAAPAAAAAAGPADAPTAAPVDAVKSPMVGTAYRAPEPGAKAFVDVGTVVKESDTLLIIEAMKTMNTIPAPRGGMVTQILVGDAQPVEYGEPLMIIE